MKGMELPVSTMIVVAVAVLVLVVLSSFFLSGSGKQFSQIDMRSRFNQECTKLKCTFTEASALETRQPELFKACRELYGPVSSLQCANACGCRVSEEAQQEIRQAFLDLSDELKNV